MNIKDNQMKKNLAMISLSLCLLFSTQAFADGLFDSSAPQVEKNQTGVKVQYGSTKVYIMDVKTNAGVSCVLAISDDERSGMAIQCAMPTGDNINSGTDKKK
jgi:hypothetical protein